MKRKSNKTKSPLSFAPKDVVRITTSIHSIVLGISTMAIEQRRLLRVYPFGLRWQGWCLETDHELIEQYAQIKGMKPENFMLEHAR